MKRYKDAFYQPLVADLSNFGAWTDAGALTSTERATAVWREALTTFTPPSHSGEVAERIKPYIEQHTASGGALPSGG